MSDHELSVVICSLNGADGVARCLGALAGQTAANALEVVVVDDGSSDPTADVAAGLGARVVRHETNRGLAAARNSGVHAASAPVVAFLDDDVVPAPDWAERLLGGYVRGAVGVGGAVLAAPGATFMERYLERHNPLEVLELELATSEALPYRGLLYLRRQWAPQRRNGQRPVYSLVGANMSFRREALLASGLFDTRFTFGAEELDLCRRIGSRFPDRSLVFEPAARVWHWFEPQLADTLRRSRAYGRGSARMARKWRGARPTIFPWPLAVAVLAGLAARRRVPWWLVALAPQALLPRGLLGALRGDGAECLVDPYVELLQEAANDLGVAEGLWLFRDLVPEPLAP